MDHPPDSPLTVAYYRELSASKNGGYRFDCELATTGCKRVHACLGSVSCAYRVLDDTEHMTITPLPCVTSAEQAPPEAEAIAA